MIKRTHPDNEGKRLRAFELYMSASVDGKRRSLRSIAQELGVSLGAVQYWRDHDLWDTRVRETLLNATRTAEIASATFKMAVRQIMTKGLSRLENIILEGKEQHAIAAVREITNIAQRFQAIELGGGMGPNVIPEWNDDLGDATAPTSDAEPPKIEGEGETPDVNV